MDGRLYWIWLACVLGQGNNRAEQLLERFSSPERIWRAGAGELSRAGVSAPELAALLNKSLERPEKILSDCAGKNISVLTPDDPDYPERLRNIPQPPLTLYCRGTLPPIDDLICVAIVGSRDYSVYGRSVAEKLASGIAGAGAVVVSGMARGLDTAAHKGALKAGGLTVAVLGCGVDVVYPRENAELMRFIETSGAVLSEYPPGTPPLPYHFPQRNRIISGLSLGVTVIEGGEKSGSLITARHALEQGRDVFAVPANIDSPGSAAPNGLIKQGAKPVTSPMDILEEYLPLFAHKIRTDSEQEPDCEAQPDLAAQEERDYRTRAQLKSLSPDEQAVLALLPQSHAPVHRDELAAVSGLGGGRLFAALTMLEVTGLAISLPGGRYARS